MNKNILNVTYSIRTDIIPDEDDNKHTVYGIGVLQNGAVIKSVPDMFFSRSKAEQIIGLCNDLELDPIHIPDVIEDMLV